MTTDQNQRERTAAARSVREYLAMLEHTSGGDLSEILDDGYGADGKIASLSVEDLRILSDDARLGAQGQAKREEECVPDDLCPECRGQITSWFCEPCGNTGKVTRSAEPS